MNVGEALGLLHKTYASIDLRAFIGRNSTTDSFKCIFSKISFSRIKSTSINDYMNLKRLRGTQSERFRLLFESIPIEYFSEVEKRIMNDRLSLENIHFTIRGLNEPISRLNIENYISDHITSRYTHWFAIKHRNPVRSNLGAAEDLRYNEVAMGIKFENLGGWFDMPRYVWSRFQPLLLVLFPIYIRRYTISSEKQHIVISYLIHKNLIHIIDSSRVVINFRSRDVRYDAIDKDDSPYHIDKVMKIRKIKLIKEADMESIDVYFKILGLEEKIYQDRIMISDIWY
jgi:hypothetical protein